MDFNRIICIDFEYCASEIKKRLSQILAAAMAGVVLGVFVSFFVIGQDDSYRATATVYSFADGSYDESAQGLNALRAYSEIVKSRKIAERAKVLLGPTSLTVSEIYNMISIDARFIQGSTYIYEDKTAVLKIYADSSSQTDSTAVVNAVADAFVQEINHLSDSNAMRVLDYSAGAGKIYDAAKQRTLAIYGCAAGAAFLYILYVFLRVILSPNVETVKDMELYGQLTILGMIPDFKE